MLSGINRRAEEQKNLDVLKLGDLVDGWNMVRGAVNPKFSWTHSAKDVFVISKIVV